MAITTKNDETGTIMSDIANIKHDLASLTRDLGKAAIAETTPARDAVGKLGDEAIRIAESVKAKGGHAAKAIGRQVEEQPVMSLLMAFAAGFIGSRLLSR